MIRPIPSPTRRATSSLPLPASAPPIGAFCKPAHCCWKYCSTLASQLSWTQEPIALMSTSELHTHRILSTSTAFAHACAASELLLAACTTHRCRHCVSDDARAHADAMAAQRTAGRRMLESRQPSQFSGKRRWLALYRHRRDGRGKRPPSFTVTQLDGRCSKCGSARRESSGRVQMGRYAATGLSCAPYSTKPGLRELREICY